MIKISSGLYRSRVILTPEEGTLPTKNRVREAMMSAIYPYINGARVLDLFAGSGALGIEALSRGAKEAVFVDSSKEAAGIVSKNLSTLREKRGMVLNLDYIEALKRLEGTFDIVFLDPPYAMKESYQNSLNMLLERGLLSKECALVLEYEGEITIDVDSSFERRDYTYGKSKVILLRRSL